MFKSDKENKRSWNYESLELL